jgi:hypothetical protein
VETSIPRAPMRPAKATQEHRKSLYRETTVSTWIGFLAEVTQVRRR